MTLTFSKMRISIVLLGLPVLGIKVLIMSPIFSIHRCERHLCHCRLTDFTAYRLNNKWTNTYGEFESFMLSMVAKHNRRPRLYSHLLLLFRGYAPLLSSNTYAWHLLNRKPEKTSFLLLN
jgi:hypothetical protein